MTKIRQCFAVAAVSISISMIYCCSKVNRTPQCYIFPSGFVGWASVAYGVESADLTKSNQECIVFDFSRTAHVKTSLSAPVGWAADRFLEAVGGSQIRLKTSDEATRRAIREQYFETLEGKTTEWIFIGTQAEFESTADPNVALKSIRGKEIKK